MAAIHHPAQTGDSACRREILGMRTAWNFALDLEIFALRYRRDPVRMAEVIDETIRQVLAEAGGAGRLRGQQFLIWRSSGVYWHNGALEHRRIINTKVTSAQRDIGVVDELQRGFKRLPGYVGVWPGGHPIGEGAAPVFWFAGGLLQALSMPRKARIEEYCASLYARITLTEAAVLRNPYAQSGRRGAN
jgi:hypothetical protein